MSTEETCIKKLLGGINAIKKGVKKPNEVNLSITFQILKKSNEPMHDDLMKQYKDAILISKYR